MSKEQPPTNLVPVTVNGTPMMLNAQGPLLRSLQEAGLKHSELPPYHCWHPDIPCSGGRCRACLCSVNGRIVPACVSKVQANAEIVTTGHRLEVLHRDAELLGSRDAVYSSTANAPPEKMNVHHQHEHKKQASTMKDIEDICGEGNNISSKDPQYVVRYPTLCQHCNLCVQMCQSIQKVGAIADIRSHVDETEYQVMVDDHHQGAVSAWKQFPLASMECITCGQCVNVCPFGALEEEPVDFHHLDTVFMDSSKPKVVQFAPAVRVALAEEFGCEPGTRLLTKEMVTAARQLGNNVHVFDTNFTADLTIVEEGYELLERLRRQFTGVKKFGPEHMETALPMITSCSPGWVLFCEKNFHSLLPHLSSCKSPQQMHGALTKRYWAKKIGLNLKEMLSVSVMPCVAKKFEKNRPEFVGGEGEEPDVDVVLTTRQFAQYLKYKRINPTQCVAGEFDHPFGIGTGAGVIFGATGGVMEAALRTAVEVVTGREVPFKNLEISPVRGMASVREASIHLEGVLSEWSFLEGVELNVAVVHGTGNARRFFDEEVIGRQRQGLPVKYHFIEVMGCPGGCVGGGGQPKPTNMSIKAARAKLIYEEDRHLPLRKSHENRAVKQLYDEFLIEPLGPNSHHLLHTKYTARKIDYFPGKDHQTNKQASDLKIFQEKVLDHFPPERARITNLLSAVVDLYGSISDDHLVAIAGHVDMTPVELEGIISHYHYFIRTTSTYSVVNDSASGDHGAAVQNTPPSVTIFLCECVTCRRAGADQVKQWLLKEPEVQQSNSVAVNTNPIRNGLRVRTTSWLGWCVNGAPAALVRRVGDEHNYVVYNLAANDPRFKASSSTNTTSTFPLLFTETDPGVNFIVRSIILDKQQQQKDQAPSPSALGGVPSVLANVVLSDSDLKQFAADHICPISKKAFHMNPDEIITVMQEALLRGCGGAGFPSFMKWKGVASAKLRDSHAKKYIVVNADEGLPTTFKDYYLLHDPQSLLRMISGVGIAAHTVGASHCIVYLRYEYKYFQVPLQEAFASYQLMNPFLPQDFVFEIVIGGGPYICGEETALFESVEGYLPQARVNRTVFPTEYGVFGQPTLISNVETFCWVPSIIYYGAEAFCRAAQSTSGVTERGGKLLCVAGDVSKPMLLEVPMGITVGEVLHIATHADDNDQKRGNTGEEKEEQVKRFQEQFVAVEVGGVLEMPLPITEATLNKALSLQPSPSTLTAAGSFVLFGRHQQQGNTNQQDSYQLLLSELFPVKSKFCQIESCQLCAPCREGTTLFRRLVHDIQAGILAPPSSGNISPGLSAASHDSGNRKRSGEWEQLLSLMATMEIASNCAHGKAAGTLGKNYIRSLSEKKKAVTH